MALYLDELGLCYGFPPPLLWSFNSRSLYKRAFCVGIWCDYVPP